MRSEQEGYLSKLGLKDPVSKEQIKAAFRELIKKHHPDVAHGINNTKQSNQTITQNLIVAYSWLMKNHEIEATPSIATSCERQATAEELKIGNDRQIQQNTSRDLLGPIFDVQGKIRVAELVWRVALGCMLLLAIAYHLTILTVISYGADLIGFVSCAWGWWLLGSPRDLDRFYGSIFFSRVYPPQLQKLFKPRYWVILFICVFAYATFGGLR